MTSLAALEPGPPVPASYALPYIVLDGDPLHWTGYEQYDLDLPKDTPEALLAAVRRLSDEFDGAGCGFCGTAVGWTLEEDDDSRPRSAFRMTTIVLRPPPATKDLWLCEECGSVLLDDPRPSDPDPPYAFTSA